MAQPLSTWPFEPAEALEELLREQGATPEECGELLPALRRLSEWQAPQPELLETHHLLTRLVSEPPMPSPVREAIREHQPRRGAMLLSTARTQVSLFGPAFWLVSALITLVGAAVVLSLVVPDQRLVLGFSGPLLAYLGTIVAFRGRDARVVELELACPPSPLQLALARLVIVLGYDVALSLALGLTLWAGGATQVLALTLAWLMPLLLVVGLALLLSLRLSVQTAASLAYAGWLAILVIGSASPLQAHLFTPPVEVLLGCLGVVGIAIALRFHNRVLPHSQVYPLI